MKSIKTVSSNIFTLAFAFILAAGCASVTDVNADLPDTSKPAIETTTTDGSFWDNRVGDSMDPIIDRPKTGGGSLD